jgi:DNA uptake protein ComE-like DNA-binding protein
MQILMLLFVLAGLISVALPFRGAAGFQRETDPAVGTWGLVKKVMRSKAPPVLAPGVMLQLGLNNASREEFVLVPGTGTRMAREFAEYRPWKSWAQVDKEIGKGVGPKEAARFWRYVVIQ